MSTIGRRITEERERLGFSQTDLTHLTGYPNHIQASYEYDETMPASSYLQEIARHGFNTLYVITGHKEKSINLSTDEQVVVDNYRAMNKASRLNIPPIGNTITYSSVSQTVKTITTLN
ncbi:helix-turn-helix domain-containing protein [Xenorhabdus cabanillasii]|uniref:HTH cro/C1-type domain-containing protein n=1 Tax=Xenorhabdus cabanillasii JM26 TaxID=1427517 RepID=W1J6N8_9GAMM|nr:helix-turn-helix transcriptional regulator [Xenorhabdus cabanillasii]PHM76976.1 transcriptional regulator [Xenorhabdus cabanillasii JM26]CDL85713.1 hypothetical protein XCR1_2300003 [Xenorhabdus cabanillasii JM26]